MAPGALGARPAAMAAADPKRRARARPARAHADGLRRHWPEYLMEGWALGMFMVSAGLFAHAALVSRLAVRAAIPDGMLRRALMGLAMGLTAIAIIYSPWGQRSGAHINPAVTLTFWRLGKVATWDAVFYVAAQFAGGLLGVLLVAGRARQRLRRAAGELRRDRARAPTALGRAARRGR